MGVSYYGYTYDPVYERKRSKLREKYKQFYLKQGVGIFKADHIADKKAKRDLRNNL